jgi:DNA-binding transcriptional ArsR family regulator
VQFFCEQLADLARVFDGDIPCVMVLAVLGQHQLRGMLAQSDPKLVAAAFPTNASRLADATGIPRETVRRKLRKLEELGWIESDGAGGWKLVVADTDAQARIDLKQTEDRSIRRICTFVARFEQLVDKYSTGPRGLR